MAKTLVLSLDRALIIEGVKADTYITGEIDKSADAVKNAALAYNEQAGDDNYHERKLIRTLRGAVAKFEANLAEFVDTSAENSITNTLPSTTDLNPTFTISVKVSDRYNSGLAEPMSALAMEYIINMMLYAWWQSIKPNLAKDYIAFANESLTAIRLCLAKTAPATASGDYAQITGTVTNGSGSSSDSSSSSSSSSSENENNQG